MPIHHDDINDMIVPGLSQFVTMPVPAPPGLDLSPDDLTQRGLLVARGQAIVHNRGIIPIVAGRISIRHFFEYNPSKVGDIFANAGASIGVIKNAVAVAGQPHYYHFLANHLSGLLLLRGTTDSPATWACSVGLGYPPELDTFVRRFIANIVAPRECRIQFLPHGLYDVENVVFAMRPTQMLPAVVCNELVVPMVLDQAGIADPIRELGPVKLFIRREGNLLGRNLVNSRDVEAWFAARGYTPVNPGELSFAEQVVLFARATHIAGIEGGALTNLLFAINVQQVVMIASPATASDPFFQSMVKHRAVPFFTLYGAHVGSPPFDRTADFTLPMPALAELETATRL